MTKKEVVKATVEAQVQGLLKRGYPAKDIANALEELAKEFKPRRASKKAGEEEILLSVEEEASIEKRDAE